MPPAATCATLLRPTQLCEPCCCPLSWPHAPHRHASCSHTCYIAAPHPAARATSLPPLMAACTTSLCPTQLCVLHHCPLSWPHTPHCHASHSHMCHITAPHPAVHATSPPLLQLHTPCHCAPPSCMHYIAAPSCGHMHCITTLPQPHAPHRCTLFSCVHHVATPLAAIYANATSPCPSLPAPLPLHDVTTIIKPLFGIM